MSKNFYCVIMAGGIGTRFWPLSRSTRPKQFLNIENTDRSFVRHTYDRFSKLFPPENILVVTTSKFKDLLMRQIPSLREENIILEPYRRDTAPCIAYAAYTLLKRNPEATMVITPADHLVKDEDLFLSDIGHALEYTRNKDILMTLGLTPTRPDPNYGYIQVSGGPCKCHDDEAVKVKTFTEKPDIELAKVFIQSGEFFWNSGIFVWKAETIIRELERYLPELTKLFSGWENAIGSPVEEEFIEKVYSYCIKISIDYGVMEKTDKAWMFPTHFDWADITSWESLYNFIQDKDNNGNVLKSDNILSDGNVENLIITTNRHKLIAVKGLKEFMVVDTDDALLICPKDDKSYKELVSSLGMPEYEKFK